MVLGLALAVKTWAVADIVLLAGWLCWRSGRRAAAAFACAAFGTAAAVCLPFFLAAPGAMFHQVVSDQLGRTQRLTPDPVVFLHEVAGVGQVYGRSGATPAAAIAVIAAFVLAVAAALWRGPRIWAVLAIASLALVVPQRSYTYHYIDFAAPALAACAGIATAALLRAARRVRVVPAAPVAGAAVAAVLAMLAWQSVTHDVVGSPAQSQFRGFFAAHPCAFSDYPSLLAAADAETRQVRLHCANLVDYTGAALAAGNGRMLIKVGHGNRSRFYRFPAWQAQVRQILAASDAAVLSWRPERWTPATQLFFHQRFRKLSQAGNFTLWILRT
jgi:alpha-1,2-mannosyltransferase